MATKKLRDFDATQIMALAIPGDGGDVIEIRNVPSKREAFNAALLEHGDVDLTQVSETEWDSGSVTVLTLRDKKRIVMDVPAEFFDFCEERGVTPCQVIAGLIGDLCDINTPASIFNSHGSDERMLARQWFDRVCWPQ